MFKKIQWKRFFLTFFILSLCVFIFLSLHIWKTWQSFKQIQQDYRLSSTHEEVFEVPKKRFVLFKNNIILRLDLERLLPFIDLTQTANAWIQEQIDSGFLVPIHKDKLLVMENLEFEIDAINDCDLVQCYQKRIPFYDIPPALWRGLIGIEDERFLSHKGVDPLAMLRAILVDLKELKLVQGGSTITQQVARNLYLGLEKSFSRKWKEILFSFFMESQLSKEDILQIYLNEVFWGSLTNIRIKGVYAAATYYFGKKPTDLTPYEVSTLVAMLKGPNYFHPLRNTQRLKDRSNLLLTKLLEMQLVPQSAKIWTEQEWSQWKTWLAMAQEDKRLYVVPTLIKRPASQISFYEEYILASEAERILADIKAKPKMVGQDMAYKIMVEDLSCVYGRSTDEGVSAECPPSFMYYSKIERNLSEAFQTELHQIGSLLKPIVYRAAMNFGKNMSDSISTETTILKVRAGDWVPGESSKVDRSIKEMTLREALQKSRNIPVVRLTQDVGFEAMESYIYPYVPKLMKPLSEFPAQLLGGVELSFFDLAEMYAKFIKDECFDILNKVIDESTSPLLVLSHPDETTIAASAQAASKEKQFFGKTGTSNNSNDNWFVGFDGRHLFILWFGNERKEQQSSLELSGAWYAFRAFEPSLLYRGREVAPFNCQLFQEE